MKLSRFLVATLPAVLLLAACDGKPSSASSQKDGTAARPSQAAAAGGTGSALMPPLAPQPLAMTDAEFEVRLKKTLLDHPEWLVEMGERLRAYQVDMQKKSFREAVAQNAGALAADELDPVLGASDAPVTIVEFFDYQCPYCKGVAPAMAQLIAEDKGVRLVLKEMPILGQPSRFAAAAMIAAKRVDPSKIEAFHAALMADKTPEHELTNQHVLELATSVGYKADEIERGAAAPEIDKKLDANIDLARRLHIAGTPAFVIAGEVIPGVPQPAALGGLIASARQKALEEKSATPKDAAASIAPVDPPASEGAGQGVAATSGGDKDAVKAGADKAPASAAPLEKKSDLPTSD